MAKLQRGHLGPSTIPKTKIKQVFEEQVILITVPVIYPNEDKNMFYMKFNVCKAQ